jgi:hypothetical protein
MAGMGVPRLATRKTMVLVVTAAALGALATSPARAESHEPPAGVRLALAAAPATAGGALAIDEPGEPGDAPTPAAPSSRSPWWVWAFIAASVAGVAALVVTSSGKAPTCPGDRTCM